LREDIKADMKECRPVSSLQTGPGGPLLVCKEESGGDEIR